MKELGVVRVFWRTADRLEPRDFYEAFLTHGVHLVDVVDHYAISETNQCIELELESEESVVQLQRSGISHVRSISIVVEGALQQSYWPL